jgi:hypothetical protein
MNGKIARLPRSIRNELNTRLDDGVPYELLLKWVNSQPAVKAVLAADFEGEPITKQNLYCWKQHGFRSWKIRRNALEFTKSLDESEDEPSSRMAADELTDKLVQWLNLRYASLANSLALADEDPEAEVGRLRDFAADILALRRGDLSASRMALAQRRIALLESNSSQHKEKEFWKWLERPDIKAKLNKTKEENRWWRQVMINAAPEIAHMLPPDYSSIDDTFENSDPAMLI